MLVILSLGRTPKLSCLGSYPSDELLERIKPLFKSRGNSVPLEFDRLTSLLVEVQSNDRKIRLNQMLLIS